MPTINGPNGHAANVNDAGKLETECITHSAEHYCNHTIKQAYQVMFAGDPAAAGDCFFCLVNNDEADMIIEGFSYMSSAAEEIYIEIANGGTAVLTDGTALTPANVNAGSANEADATCYSCVSDEAVDITGLTTGREIERIWIIAAADKKYWNFEMDVIIPKNKVFSMWAVGGDTVLRGTVVFYYHS